MEENGNGNGKNKYMESNDPILDSLLPDYISQRDSLKVMVTDLEKLKTKIESLFPERMDNRNLMFFQEKVKAVTELFKSILEIRKEIIKNIKDEMEVRRKVNEKLKLDDDDMGDIRKLAESIEKIQKGETRQ